MYCSIDTLTLRWIHVSYSLHVFVDAERLLPTTNEKAVAPTNIHAMHVSTCSILFYSIGYFIFIGKYWFSFLVEFVYFVGKLHVLFYFNTSIVWWINVFCPLLLFVDSERLLPTTKERAVAHANICLHPLAPKRRGWRREGDDRLRALRWRQPNTPTLPLRVITPQRHSITHPYMAQCTGTSRSKR